MKVPVIMQMHSGENGATAMAMILAYYKKYLPMAQVREKCLTTRNGSTPEQLVESARGFGLEAELKKTNMETLKKLKLPVIVSWNRKYYVVVCGFRGGNVVINDPSRGSYTIKEEKFAHSFSGKVIELTPGSGFVPEGKKISLWSTLWKRVESEKNSLFFILCLHSLSTISYLIILSLTRRMLDDVMSGDKANLYVPILIGFAIVFLIGFVTSVAETLRIYFVSRKMASGYGSKLYKKLLSLPLSFYEQHFAGELMERINKNSQLDYSLLCSVLPSFIDGITLIFYLVLLFMYNPIIAVSCLAIEILYIIITIWYQAKKSILARSLNTSSGAMNSSILNGFNTIETIKSTGSEKNFFVLWSASQTRYQENQQSMLKMNAFSSILGGSHNVASSALLLFMGAVFIIQGNFTLGMLSAFQSALGSVRGKLNNFVKTSNDLLYRRTDVERIEDVMIQKSEQCVELESEMQANKLDGTVSLQHVSYRYNAGDKLAVDDVSLEVKQGQMVALVGSTGCGKSTLMKLIGGLYKTQEGVILYDGKSREEIPDVVFHSSLTSVDQETVVFNDTIANNLKMWDNTVEDYEMILAARDARIHQRIITGRGGYDAEIYENGRNYSGGELQRMELARALSGEPTLLLLDEFTSALDALTEEKIFQSLRDKKTTCILAAHRFSTVVECDWIVVMDKGKIIEQGTHEQLYQAGGRYKQLVDMQ